MLLSLDIGRHWRAASDVQHSATSHFMKTCSNCGVQNPDDAMRCQACSTTTFISSSPEAIGGHIISPEEQRFWH
jgi:RNA polymerase subunit RPABC4/transcription elongation factor Spt4